MVSCMTKYIADPVHALTTLIREHHVPCVVAEFLPFSTCHTSSFIAEHYSTVARGIGPYADSEEAGENHSGPQTGSERWASSFAHV